MKERLATEDALHTALTESGVGHKITDKKTNISSGPAPLASPSYQALESTSWIVQTDSGNYFIKAMHPEVIELFDLDVAMALAHQAGEAGIAPKVVWSDPRTGTVVMEAFTEEQGWRTATQADLQNSNIVDSVMNALKTLEEGKPLTSTFNPFARIDSLIKRFHSSKLPLPEDINWLQRVIIEATPLLEQSELKCCRNDGSSSNLLIGPNEEIKLIDFDHAGMMDPLYEVGAILAETTDFESTMQKGFISWAGTFDPHMFARARIWSFVDDLLHGLEARFMAYQSVRTGIEWLKYSEWRFMRLRMALTAPHFEEKLRLARDM